MTLRLRVLSGPLLLFAFLCPFSSSTVYAKVLEVHDQSSLDLALISAAAGDTVRIVGAGIQQGIARLTVGIRLICDPPYSSSLRHLEAIDLSHETVVEELDFSGGWPPMDNPLPPGTPDANVLISASSVSFVDCRFEGLAYAAGYYFKTRVWPVPYVSPIALVDSEVNFTGCWFEGNGGDIFLSEGPAYGCIHQFGSGVTSIDGCTFQDQPYPIAAKGPVGILGSTFRHCGPGLIYSETALHLSGSLIVGCGPSLYESCYICSGEDRYSFARSIQAFGQVQIEHNTFVDNPMVAWYYGLSSEIENPEIYVPLIVLENGASGVVSHNLFIGVTGPAMTAPSGLDVSCNDAWESQSSLWTGGMGDVSGHDGNISQAPIFCSRIDSNYTLSSQSPAIVAPCGVMGAFPAACDRETPVAIQDFSARWTSEGVSLQWEFTATPGLSPIAVLERLDGNGMHEIYRGTASSFFDPAPPEEGPLQYALSYEVDGRRDTAQEWTRPSGEPTVLHTRLLPARPNPFNPRTSIQFVLDRASQVSLQIFDQSGRLVKTLIDAPCTAGQNEVIWEGDDSDGSPVASGVYLYQLRTKTSQWTKRMVLLR